MRVGIIGLGLMGGSLALALRKYKLVSKIYGCFRSVKQTKEVLDLNLVDEVLNIDELKEKSDLIVLAISVDKIIEYIPKLLDININTTIVDLGSTKKSILDNIPLKIRSNFIGAHPMVGTEKSGPSAAIENFYENSVVVLCDTNMNSSYHLNRVKNIFSTIQMKIIDMNSSQHDIHACFMSHLPHAISFALANTVMNHEDPISIVQLAAGGFKDMSRVAKSSPSMWIDIFKQNRDNLLESLDLFKNQMNFIQTLLEDEKYDELENWMKKANTLHKIL
jgi:prephenate dehydrogenase